MRLQPIETLSKGFKRRVGLAQALLHDPPVLVLDEPTDGLDPNQKHEVRELIRRMAPDKAIVISTHILEEVDAVCTRAIIIARGRVVVDARPRRWRAGIRPARWRRCSATDDCGHRRAPWERRKPGGPGLHAYVLIVARRELAGYFATPVATVFIVIFLVLPGALTFNLGNFFGRGQADLQPFFSFVPWLFLFLVPGADHAALGGGTPARHDRAAADPAAAAMAGGGRQIPGGLGLLRHRTGADLPARGSRSICSGSPDNGVILSGYVGCLLVAGAYLALGAAVSALTKNQVVAFVLAVALCFVFAARPAARW